MPSFALRSVLASMVFSACAADPVAAPDDDRNDRDERGAEEGVHQPGRVIGRVSGLTAGAPARVILGNDSFLDSAEVVAGELEFRDVPDGTYFAKLDVTGHVSSETQLVTVRDGAGRIDLTTTPLAGGFRFSWTEDASRGGREGSSDIAPHSAAAQQLFDHYNIALSDAGQPWTQEHAARLLRMMRAVPQQVRSVSQPYWLKPSTWTLSAGADDLQVTRTAALDTIRISSSAFSDAEPSMVAPEGQRDAYFSKRLHRAVVRYVTNEGTSAPAVARILTQRYGVTTTVADYTRLTTEPATSFQAFAPTELVDLISTFEEMPDGLHAVDGLTTLVRRTTGGTAPVLAAPQRGYLELTEAAFRQGRAELHHALVREKARFVVTPELEAAWSSVGMDATLVDAIADYVSAPAEMRDRSAPAFELIRDQIMTGGLELDPDPTWPGQITGVAISVVDQPDVGQRLTVELDLRTDATTFTGASSAAIRMYSLSGSSVVMALEPVTESGSVVRGEIVLRAPMQSGFWRPDQIVIRDHGGMPLVHSAMDLGWKLFIE